MPLYPLYALLFLDTGLSTAEVSGLFAVWSVTALLAEVPGGALADRWSRRGVLALGGVLQALAFVVWTVGPSAAGFAAGFAVWGLAGALVSGTVEALVHDGLADLGAEEAFARVHGWMTSAELLVQVPTAAAAGGLYALGGYPLVGWASVAVCLAWAALALRFPEPPREPDGGSLLGTLRLGLADVAQVPALRLTVLAMALVGGLDAVEEYFPVLAGDRGVPTVAVPLAVLGIALAGALGAALGGRVAGLPDRALPALLLLAGVLLGAVAVLPGPAALAVVAASYGLYLAVLVVAEARLQERIESTRRATVTSVAGVGVEVGGLLVFAAWAAGGVAAVAVLVLAVVPVAAAGLRRPVS
ncbi:Predicted arabinose efflux permease, MFS family [Geodermatophilus pulveris]|uniref:Predicted arabinose efflux permease, MFS family n=1 Tax=Geodermatophilus pulveris TaxID=1564159 RepID=A0A239IZ19_9ACTN|nr:MFS transporter [Geodermatophilus pulveris]SNS98871.1 Predicted arabinose efflux permease, MFS family [Geodermatophilus pulveris]